MSVDLLATTVLVGTLVLLVAVVAVRISTTTGMPSLLLYLGLGMLLGRSGAGITFSDYQLTTVLGYCALVVILTEGGLTTRWSSIRPSVAPAAVLATIGTVVSVLVTAAVTHWLLDLGWSTALLLGAIVSSTDAAAVFSVLRRVPLPRRLSGMLEAESGFNDAPVVILVVALSQAATGQEQHPVWLLAVIAVAELAGGVGVGLLVGYLGVRLLRAVALPSTGLYPISVLGLCGLAYGVGDTVHVSGFLAVYVAALVLGNSTLPHGHAVRGFAEGSGWLAQIGLFVMLGLLIDPPRLIEQFVPALVAGAALLLLARPLSVLVSTTWFGIGWRDQVFLSWAGLRGAVPIVLATIPVTTPGANSRGLFEEVFLMVIVFTGVQAPTLPWIARALQLVDDTPRDLDVDTSPLGAFDAHVLQVQVGPTSLIHGMEVHELRLPAEAKVTLVVREGDSFVPTTSTRLRHGDEMLIVATDPALDAVEKRLHVVSRGGRLAHWHEGRAAKALGVRSVYDVGVGGPHADGPPTGQARRQPRRWLRWWPGR